MSQVPYLLRDRNLFAFDEAAAEEITREFAQVEAQGGEVDPLLVELVCLTAAEYSLARWMPYQGRLVPLQNPIQVEHRDAVLGFLKADCNPMFPFCFDWHDGDGLLNLADMTAFSSDVAKLARLELRVAPDLDDTIGDLARAVDTLEAGHLESPSPRARALGASGILRLQGFLWAVKASLPRNDLEHSVAAAQEAFELTQPVEEPEPVPG
jgi:hypothetical protein